MGIGTDQVFEDWVCFPLPPVYGVDTSLKTKDIILGRNMHCQRTVWLATTGENAVVELPLVPFSKTESCKKISPVEYGLPKRVPILLL